MMDRAAMSPAAHLVTVLACVLATGCACGRHAQTEPVATATPAASIPVAETTQAQAAPAPPPPSIEPERPVQPAPATQAAVPKAPVAPATPVAPDRPPRKPSESVAVTPAPVPAVRPAPAPAVAPRAVPAPAAPQPAAAPLDLESLESRLRQTSAIGMFTKLSLKNQVNDLIDRFRAYHRRQGSETLADLRRKYDMLFMKVLSLLQDSDPSLARDIVKSRTAIWSILEDPRKFAESNLMAGATP
jgi:outer membrane biosynthesis protein TonB